MEKIKSLHVNCVQGIKNLQLSDEIVDESHLGSENQTELEYQLAWARTYLKNFGVILNSARSVWAIESDYTAGVELDSKEIIEFIKNKNARKQNIFKNKKNKKVKELEDVMDEYPEKIKPWRKQLSDIL